MVSSQFSSYLSVSSIGQVETPSSWSLHLASRTLDVRCFSSISLVVSSSSHWSLNSWGALGLRPSEFLVQTSPQQQFSCMQLPLDIHTCLSGTSNVTCLKLNSSSSPVSLFHSQPSPRAASSYQLLVPKSWKLPLTFHTLPLIVSISFCLWNVARILSFLIPSTGLWMLPPNSSTFWLCLFIYLFIYYCGY